MSEKSYSIFLSCGTPDTKAQEEFRAAVKAHLKSHDCESWTVGDSKFSSRQPVETSRDLIGSCDGAIVIAFERTRILQGLDKPQSANPGEIVNQSHPTVWNHMEAAMAYAQRVPILTLVQSGLKRQGMLSDRLEWKAIEGDLRPELLNSEEFRQVFADWMAYVRKSRVKSKKLDLDVEKIKIVELIGQLTLKQAFGVFGALSGAAVLCFILGQWYQVHFGP